MISKLTEAIIKKRGSFASHFPKLVRFWDKKKNLPLKSSEVTFKSSRKVWWNCEKKHSWQESIQLRYLGWGKCKKCK